MARPGLTAFRWGWTTAVVLLTSAPYLIDWWSTPSGHQFTWILPPYPEDSFGYRAWMQQAADGAWLFKIKYTALPHAPFLFNPFFLTCGRIGALLHANIGVVCLVMKAAGTTLLLALFYRYTDYLRLKPAAAVAAAILLGVSSGLGGLLALFGFINNPSLFPADLWMPEMSTFWSVLWNPLFPFSLTLMLISIYWVDRGTAEARSSDLWRAGLATGLMGLVHPYSLPLLFALVTIITVVRRRKGAPGYLLRYLAAVAPFAIYIFASSHANVLVEKHSLTGAMKSPPLAGYLFGFGLPLLWLVAAIISRRAFSKNLWLLTCWFLLSIGFAYLPFWFQRKFVFGAHIPLSILAGVALVPLFDRWSRGWGWKVVLSLSSAILFSLFAATPIYLLIDQYRTVKANADGAYYVSNELMEGLEALKQQSRPEDVVFARYATSRLIPAISGNTVVWGHWAMSVDLKERQTWFSTVFSTESDERRSVEFWGDDVKFVFADGDIKQWFEGHPFMTQRILHGAPQVFRNEAVVIYRRPDGLLK